MRTRAIGIMSQKRPRSARESRKRDSFLEQIYVNQGYFFSWEKGIMNDRQKNISRNGKNDMKGKKCGTKQPKQRLNKYLAQAGICSRRQADLLIEEGKVLVNGQIAQQGMQVGPADRVELKGKQVRSSQEKLLLAFYKPIGVTCTEKDKFADKKVLDYVKARTRVTYAGRLDKESEGLMLLTNDGDLIHALMKGAHAHEKEYVVKVKEEISDDFLRKMEEGIYLKELDRTTRPCIVQRSGKFTFHIVLTQGMNRQIRRMCETCGYHVKALKRIRIMNISLGQLTPGQSRILTREECVNLYRAVGMAVPAQFLE